MEVLVEHFDQLQAIMKANPVVAGAVSLWGLAVMTWFAKSIPSAVARLFITQCTTSLTVNNAGWRGNAEQFSGFIDWYARSGWLKWSRRLALDGTHVGDHRKQEVDAIVSAGYGVHFFFYFGRLFWFSRSQLPSQGTELEKNEIKIFTIGRNQAPILRLVEDFRHKLDKSKVGVFAFDNEWSLVTSVRKRSLDTVVVDQAIKDKIVGNLSHFFANREWFDRRGMPYKLTFVLSGAPGTGKTSLISALAAHFGRNVAILNLSTMSDKTFANAIATLPERAFVVIEDFDSASAVQARGGSQGLLGGITLTSETQSGPGGEVFSFLTLSSILNTLDGLVRLDDTVIMMTTNHIDRIDPAVLRKGRVDHIYEIGYLQDAEIIEYIRLMYPTHSVPYGYEFAEIAGCDIQALFLEHKEDFAGFFDALPKIATPTQTHATTRTSSGALH